MGILHAPINMILCETWVYAWSSIWVFEWLPPKDRHQPPLNILWLPMFDNPVFPIPVKLLMRDVQAALETIRGRNIYVHCAMCRHRGVVTGVDEFLSKPQRQPDHANHFRIWYTFPMPLRILLLLALTLAILLAACQPFFLTTTPAVPMAPSIDTPQPSVIGSPTLEPTLITIAEPTLTPVSMETPNLNATLEHSRTPLPAALFLDPADWHHWPVIPIVPEYARQIYMLGQTFGNDPHAFSVFGDCQSEPNVFLGIYETDPQSITGLPPSLQETLAWFKGSLNRMSPTVRGGTTSGALLWDQWTQNKYTCTIYETPLQCEMRIHKPSFVIIHVGTHYENRNDSYMRTILDQLIAAGVVPILTSKADDRELNEHVNAQYAQLAVEYNIPFWNFWAAVDGLPNRGLYTRPDATYQGDLYLTDEAAAIQRLSALQVLDIVRRAVMRP